MNICCLHLVVAGAGACIDSLVILGTGALAWAGLAASCGAEVATTSGGRARPSNEASGCRHIWDSLDSLCSIFDGAAVHVPGVKVLDAPIHPAAYLAAPVLAKLHRGNVCVRVVEADEGSTSLGFGVL